MSGDTLRRETDLREGLWIEAEQAHGIAGERHAHGFAFAHEPFLHGGIHGRDVRREGFAWRQGGHIAALEERQIFRADELHQIDVGLRRLVQHVA